MIFLLEATEQDNYLQLLVEAVKRGYINYTEKQTLKSYRQILTETSVAQGVVLRALNLWYPKVWETKWWNWHTRAIKAYSEKSNFKEPQERGEKSHIAYPVKSQGKRHSKNL